MKKIIAHFFVLFIVISCSEDSSIEINKNSLEIAYHGYYEELIGKPIRNLTLNNIKVHHEIKSISDFEDINVLRIEVTSIQDESCFIIEVMADSLGDNVLFNNKFDFRTPEGTPYAYADLDFIALVNNEKEFMADFSGVLKHYNQLACEFIYLDIRSGSISIKY